MKTVYLALFSFLFLISQIVEGAARPTPPPPPERPPLCSPNYEEVCKRFCGDNDMCKTVCEAQQDACDCLNPVSGGRTPACSACVRECQGRHDEEQINCIGACLNRATATALEQQ